MRLSRLCVCFDQAVGGSAMQRKKSLPDVAALPAVAVKAGTQVMTREEISVLSSARHARGYIPRPSM